MPHQHSWIYFLLNLPPSSFVVFLLISRLFLFIPLTEEQCSAPVWMAVALCTHSSLSHSWYVFLLWLICPWCKNISPDQWENKETVPLLKSIWYWTKPQGWLLADHLGEGRKLLPIWTLKAVNYQENVTQPVLAIQPVLCLFEPFPSCFSPASALRGLGIGTIPSEVDTT